ncbi:MAG: hypothetical protein HY304_07955 [candidate division Zixibacteria bacterium]|nr:hypothetical protein [candidate division Zixibacteria bacterium]
MKRQLPLILLFLFGAFMVFQYFVPHESSEFFYEFVALDWPPIIGVFALSLGIISLIRMSAKRVRTRTPDWGYSVVTLAGLASMIVAGLPWFGGQESPVYKWEFQYIMQSILPTMFALLSFFIASAAYRAFRARSAVASVLLVSAFIVMIRFFPMGPLSIPAASTASWLLNVPNLAAKRAITIGVGLGIVSTALKVVLGIERSYLGRD